MIDNKYNEINEAGNNKNCCYPYLMILKSCPVRTIRLAEDC